MRQVTSALRKELIDILNGKAPFVSRVAIDKSCAEVIRLTNEDWREVTTDDQVRVSTHATEAEASKAREALSAAWRLDQILGKLDAT